MQDFKDCHFHAWCLPSVYEHLPSLMNRPYLFAFFRQGKGSEARDVRGSLRRALKKEEKKKRNSFILSFFWLLSWSRLSRSPRPPRVCLFCRLTPATQAKSTLHLSELAGQTIPAVMRILLFIKTDLAKPVNSWITGMGLMAFLANTLKTKASHFWKAP